ncbi:MAG: serine hydrolase [Proteobacteria bacterium]|nr:serine hydrolase [Pseudomonadota bacterium]
MSKPFLIAGLAVLAWLGAASASAAPDEQDGRLLDDLIGKYVSPEGAPGAAAVLVRRDGRVTLRGYGMADLAKKRVVNPETTVFRIGSISKTFTAIAILQLLDEGKIALEADANKYLKGVQIPGNGAPVRVIDLLTHRGGFDGNLTYVGLDDRTAAAQSSDQRFQRDIIRLRPAGLLPSYDNLAWGLLGHIVESIDGIPYAQAMAKRIFAPLGMKNSAVGLPLDVSNVAVPYEVGNDGKPHPKPPIFLRRGWQGAGDLSTTAADMAYFLQAMLAEGTYPGGRLLKLETFRRQVDTLHFGFHPGVPSIGLGVYALMQGFGHSGTIRGFNASLVVMPRQGYAAFAVMNLNNPAPEMSLSGLIDYINNPPGRSPIDPTEYLTSEFPYQLEQRAQPSPPPIPTALPSQGQERDWSGRYAGLRMESYEALLPRLAVAVLLNPKTVRRQADGTLFIGANGPYMRVGDGLYSLAKPSGPLITTIGFAEVGGEILMGPHTLQASRRLAWYETPVLTAGGLLLAPLILLATALLHRRRAGPGQHRVDGILAWTSLLLLAGIAAEIALAPTLERLHNLGWTVSMWRIGMGAALLTMGGAAVLGVRSAFVSMPAQAEQDLRPGHIYALAMALLTAWIWFAAIYWQLLARIF